MFECDNPQERLRDLRISNTVFNNKIVKCVTFDNKRLNSVHTHFEDANIQFTIQFSKIIKNLMSNCELLYDDIFVKETDDCVCLITQYYNDNDNERQKELDTCLLKNSKNDKIKKIIQFNEPSTNIPYNLKSNKVLLEPVNDRLSYKVAFEYANKHLKGELVCVSNSDIFLDQSSEWKNMKKLLLDNPGYVVASSRWEYDGIKAYKDDMLSRLAYANSQDAWFFIAPIKIPDDCDFLIGTLGCDNAIADRFYKTGYIPLNLANEYKIFHFDVCRKKNGKNFLNFSKEYESNKKVKNCNPEKRGQRLCPEIDKIDNIDNLVSQLKLDRYQRYEIICDIFSKYIKINNS